MKSQIKFPRNIEQHSKSLLNRLLSRNPIHRLGNGYDEIRKHPYFRGMDYNEILEKKIDPPNFPKSDCKIKKMEL
jgi:classical protein kinase C